MPNPHVADLITEHLCTGLIHPGNGADKPAVALPLPMFRTTGMPDKMADNVKNTANTIKLRMVFS
jgi:hypothetical protein